ncbi:hypothetical protein JTE90_014885 [Oedothorax gibbosus]|uniref:Protein MCM10 homolog n=1 Tax=Oedothorax gibbosus TaxID=931172 RepID=A0AAV6TXT9_9ARAC|nr:hypothetical protein JTE90_014885 [Oedothorax gibbosus]
MDNSEDLDLDSLMELLDENGPIETNVHPTPSTSTAKENPPSTSPKQVPEKSPVASKQNKISLSDMDIFSSDQGESSEKLPPNTEKLSTNEHPSVERRKVLKSRFRENFLNPEVVENPKKDEIYEKHVFNKKDSAVFNFGEVGSSDEEVEREDKEYLTETGKFVKKELEAKQIPSYDKPRRREATTWKSSVSAKTSNDPLKKSEEAFVVDSYSGIRIVNPLVSFSTLQQRMKDRKMIKMSFIQNFVKGGDIEGDWVTMGVVIGKVPPKVAKNGKPYSIWKMSDLHDAERPVSVFLFKNAHTDHWKTTVGTVVGILNSSIMPNNNGKSGELCLAVDNPGKFMLMGKSKDLGFCKSKRKDGTPCNIAVNKFQCEYCTYHVKNEYKKFSAKRSELQASFNGREPSLKNRLLKGSNVFYGGQTFTAPAPTKKPTNNNKSKDKLTLSGLGLKRKASEVLDLVEREKGVKKLAELYGPEILPAANKNSEFINEQLARPTVGSRNLLKHLMKDKGNKDQVVISPREFTKMRDQRTARGVLQRHKKDSEILQNLTPKLGRGLLPGQQFTLEFSPSVASQKTQNYAKMKAIKTIQEKGQIKKNNPNSVKVSDKVTEKVKAVLDKSLEEEKVVSDEPKSSVVKSTLGTIDLNSEKVKAILKRGSSHAYEIEMAEMEKEAAYFNRLEKKEQMEEKMSKTKEIVCNVVSCLRCKYTADTASERCKNECHPMKCHKALKRFFECKDCKARTVGFSRLPKTACRNCHGSNFERTSMMKERKGPRLDNEVLNISSDPTLFLDSL